MLDFCDVCYSTDIDNKYCLTGCKHHIYYLELWKIKYFQSVFVSVDRDGEWKTKYLIKL